MALGLPPGVSPIDNRSHQEHIKPELYVKKYHATITVVGKLGERFGQLEYAAGAKPEKQ
jgi:hypothetical protein